MSDKSSALATLADKQKEDLSRRMEALQQMQSFDWKSLPPHIMAQVLMKKPYRGKANEPDYYLTPEQALVFAMRCFELGLSPLSSEVWFDRDRWSVNVTLEGKLRLARERGNVGPPTFEEKSRPWKAGAFKVAGFDQEPGILCTITVNDKPCSYMCWMSEWYMSSSPVWKSKPLHMTTIRAYDKALAFASGAGISDMPSEREIAAEEVPETLPMGAGQMSVKRVEFKPQEPALITEARRQVDVAKAGGMESDDLTGVLKASVEAINKNKKT